MLSVPIDSPQGFGESDFRSYSISHARISALSIEHDDLDSAIDALAKTSTHDDLIIARLKKRRLQIRDEIADLVRAAQMRETPDLPQSGAAAPAQDAENLVGPAPKAGGSSLLLTIFAGLSILLVLAFSWSDAADSLNQTLARIFLLSLVAAAHG